VTGSWRLAAAIVAIWLGVYVVTQALPQPPLDVRWTLAIGVGLSVVATLGYPSPLRGPRQAFPVRGRPSRPGPDRRMLDAVERTAPHLRRGLTTQSARRTAELLRPILGGDAVAITDREHVLAFVGTGADHHHAGTDISDATTEHVVATGRTATARPPRHPFCDDPACPLTAVVVAPLRVRDDVVGSLQVARTGGGPARKAVVEAMAGILSLHLELADVDRQSQLAADARLDSLRAQINPHFLFNTLNTIASKARTDPEEARQLLLRLSDFFRYSIQQHGHFADFSQEYYFVRTYLTLEQARFGDRLQVTYDIDPQVLGVQVPVLVIQPLVENAVKHGLAPKVGGGTVSVRARVDPLRRAVALQVRDDGVGIPAAVLQRLRANGDASPVAATANPDTPTTTSPPSDTTTTGEHPDGGGPGDPPTAVGEPRPGSPSGGIGLANIHDRMVALFGDRCDVDIQSRTDEGTTVSLRIPLR